MHIHDFRMKEVPEEYFPSKDQDADADECGDHCGYAIFPPAAAEVKAIARRYILLCDHMSHYHLFHFLFQDRRGGDGKWKIDGLRADFKLHLFAAGEHLQNALEIEQ